MAHLGHQLAAPEGDIEEELQGGDRCVNTPAANTALDQIERIALLRLKDLLP